LEISTSAAVVLEQVHALAYGLRHPELNPVADERITTFIWVLTQSLG
jgi:hypothetical protein